MRLNMIRYAAVAMIAALAMAMAVMPALAEAEYPPDEPSESVTTMEEPTVADSAAGNVEDVAFTGASVLGLLAIGLAAVGVGTALLVMRRRGGADGPVG